MAQDRNPYYQANGKTLWGTNWQTKAAAAETMIGVTPIPRADMVKYSGISESELSGHLRQLLDRGYIEQTDDGSYVQSERGGIVRELAEAVRAVYEKNHPVHGDDGQ